MAGTVLGKPVKYHATGAVPTYEADLFLGYDPHARDYVGHWLDRFGAAGARGCHREARRRHAGNRVSLRRRDV